MVVAGYTNVYNGSDIVVARFNTDGSLDSSFDGDGYAIIYLTERSELANDLFIQSDGKIVLAGYQWTGAGGGNGGDSLVMRLNSNGSVDTSFGSSGKTLIDLSPGTGSDSLHRKWPCNRMARSSPPDMLKTAAAAARNILSPCDSQAVARWTPVSAVPELFPQRSNQSPVWPMAWPCNRMAALSSPGRRLARTRTGRFRPGSFSTATAAWTPVLTGMAW
ncbi:MAG: hypothetical protein H6650_02210 [Ardenticatenales bacterium]|nr:hypothetical protein [Ardenticatenales bacterium]